MAGVGTKKLDKLVLSSEQRVEIQSLYCPAKLQLSVPSVRSLKNKETIGLIGPICEQNCWMSLENGLKMYTLSQQV